MFQRPQRKQICYEHFSSHLSSLCRQGYREYYMTTASLREGAIIPKTGPIALDTIQTPRPSLNPNKRPGKPFLSNPLLSTPCDDPKPRTTSNQLRLLLSRPLLCTDSPSQLLIVRPPPSSTLLPPLPQLKRDRYRDSSNTPNSPPKPHKVPPRRLSYYCCYEGSTLAAAVAGSTCPAAAGVGESLVVGSLAGIEAVGLAGSVRSRRRFGGLEGGSWAVGWWGWGVGSAAVVARVVVLSGGCGCDGRRRGRGC